jgi:hypothetical protein
MHAKRVHELPNRERQLWKLTGKAAVAMAKRRWVGAEVGATTQQRATTTIDNEHNNQTERGTGWRKMPMAMVTMVGLAQWWTMWVGWSRQEKAGGNPEGDGGT